MARNDARRPAALAADEGHLAAVPGPLLERLEQERSTANAIYGIIVSSAVMASAHAESVLRLSIVVLATLLIYWAAERFAHVMAQRIAGDFRLTRDRVRHHLGSGWELVSASFLPLGVLLGTGLLGASLSAAVLAALLTGTTLLFFAGWRVGEEAELRPAARLVSAACSAGFGIAMIALKTLVH